MSKLAFVLTNETSIIYSGDIEYFDIIESSDVRWVNVVDDQGVSHSVNLEHVMHIVDMDTLPKEVSS